MQIEIFFDVYRKHVVLEHPEGYLVEAKIQRLGGTASEGFLARSGVTRSPSRGQVVANHAASLGLIFPQCGNQTILILF
jgi:hypothetical protein